MIKVNLKTNKATNEPIPSFLAGLDAKTLSDLSWTDPALGVSDCVWWPETIVDNHNPDTEYVDGYEYAINKETKTVTATTIIKPLAGEIITNKIVSVIAKKHSEINAIRDSKLSAGFPYSFPDTDGTIQTRDLRDYFNILGSVVAGLIYEIQDKSDTKMPFRDEEDKDHSLIPVEAMAMGMAVLSSYISIYQAAWKHKNNIKDMVKKGATISEIESYDITTGWPE